MTVQDVKGVGSKTADKLEENGITSVKELAMSSEDVLINDLSIGQGTSQKILENAREQLKTHGTGFSRGDTVDEKQQNLKKITTGSDKVDSLFGGEGVPCDYITEFYGENSSGKSQTMMSLAVNVQMPESEGGLGKGVAYIDTESAVLTERIAEIAEAKGLDKDEILENIFISQTIDAADLSEKVKSAKKLCSQEDIGIVIIDSISSHYRAEFDGRNELSERQDAMGGVIKDLQELIRTHNVAVVYTNQVYHDPGGGYGDNTIAWGGNIISHNSTFRVYLDDRGSNGWAAKLMDSPGLEQREVYFDIGEAGITDVE